MRRFHVSEAVLLFGAILFPKDGLTTHLQSTVGSNDGSAFIVEMKQPDAVSESSEALELEPQLASSNIPSAIVFDQLNKMRKDEYNKNTDEDVRAKSGEQIRGLRSPVSGWGYLPLVAGILAFVYGASRKAV